MPERCLIIGLGQIGMGYDIGLDLQKYVYSHSRAFSIHPAFDLIGAVDPSVLQRGIFENIYNLPAYPDIESSLKGDIASLVIIASPTVIHRETINEVLQHLQPKTILCEKPLAYDLIEAREMVEVCQTAGVNLFVNYMRRADPGVIEVKNRIESGYIVEPIKGFAWYSKGFLNNGSHFFNLLEFWLGPFRKATLLDAGRLWENKDPEPDVQIEFKHGKVVFLAAWEECFSHYTLELLTQSGRLRYEQEGKLISWQKTYSDPNFSGYTILQSELEIIVNGMDRYQYNVADQLANVNAEKPHYLCTGHQALETLEAIHEVIKQR